MSKAQSIVDEAIVIDAHDHTLDHAFRDKQAIDTPAERAGGVTAGIFASVIAATSTEGCGPRARDHPFHTLLEMFDYFYDRVDANGNLMPVNSAADIEKAKNGGKVAAVLGLEGADPLNGPYCNVASLRML